MTTIAQLLVMSVLSASANFSADLKGDIDRRKDTWGRSGSHEWRMKFNPPIGYRVRVLRVYGDIVAWPRGKPPEGTYAGVLFGLMNTGPEGSDRVYPAADNCFLYVQTGTNGNVARAAFDNDVSAGGLLREDHTMIVRVAVFLNDTEKEIHIEPTFVIVYRWEKSNDN